MEYLCSLVRPSVRKKNLDHLQAYMPHELSEDSSKQPDGPLGPTP